MSQRFESHSFKLSDEAHSELAILLKDEYGYELPHAEVEEVGTRLLRLFDILLRPTKD